MFIIRTYFILLLFHFIFSLLCNELEKFNQISANDENTFEIGLREESCYEYSLSENKNKIGFSFSKILSPSAEVLLYKSKSDIWIKDNLYQGYYDRFLIAENPFKEIDLTDFKDKIFIIVRDSKYSKIYKNTFVLYDNQIPIALKNGIPITMKFFFSDNIYKFIYHSSGNLTFVYSPKVKSKKYISVIYNDITKAEKQIDESDEIYYLKSENNTDKTLFVTIEDFEKGTEDQEFSVIVYEKGMSEFLEIKKNELYYLNYINLNNNDEIQTFYYYYIVGNSIKTNTINLKIDPIANKTNYINVISGFYHSIKEVKSYEFDKVFRLEENRLPIEYDLNSDEFKKIYFQDSDTSYPYRYILFKIEISKLDNYYSPKKIRITVGEEVQDIYYSYIDNYKTQIISKEIKPHFPTYFKLKLNEKEKYIFNSPYPNNTIYIKGDLVKKDENQNIIINTDYFVDEDEIFVFSGISEFTVAIFCSESFKATFYLEKYIENDLYILENLRNNDPFEIKFDENECKANKKKYLLGIYNKEIYTKMNKTFTKYWTSNDGEMNVYYRNNVTLEGQSLFPYLEKYKIGMESFIYINNYLDFFTFTCNKPGSLTLRSQYKIFNETTYKIGQNTINTINIGTEIEILQLTAPIKPPSNFLCFAIFSKNGKKIKISPDFPKLFDETTIEGEKIFTLKIDLYKFEPDQLAIKVNSTENTQIEVVEVIRYNFTEYTILKGNEITRFTDNHFVKFLSEDTKKIKVIIIGLNNVEITYGLVKLFTDNVEYLPMAYQFKDSFIKRKKANAIEIFELDNIYYRKNDNKKYLAFIFSIPNYKYYEFDAQVISSEEKEEKEEKDNSNNNRNNINNSKNWGIIIICIIGGIIIIGIIILIVFFIIKKKENKNKYEMDLENNDSKNNENNENLFRGFNDE